MSLNQLYAVLLAGGLVLLASIAAARTAARLGLPSLLLFLAVGVILGEDVLGIRFDDALLAQTLGTSALAIILVEGGLSTRWTDLRRLVAPSALLATVGVGISVIVTAIGVHLILGMPWQTALLLSAVLSSTDSAAVFSVLRALPLPRRLAGMVEAESGFNDAPTVILVLVFSTAPADLPTPLQAAGQMLYQLTAGAVIGVTIGWAGVAALRYVALPATGLYPLATVGLGVIAFSAGGAAGASGIIAAYLSGIVLGNAALPHRAATRSFAEGLAWLAQIGLFVMLGLLVNPSELAPAIIPAVVVGLILLLAGRPVSVLLCLLPFRIPWREQAFISWAGLRGAVPVVLATFPIVAQVPGSDLLLDIVFVLIVIFTLIQGPTLPTVARLLGVIQPGQAREVNIESAPLDVLNADLLTVTVPPGSRLHGAEIFELRLPKPAVVTLIIRDGTAFVPDPGTRLHERDEILIVTTSTVREQVERRLRAVDRRGRLAHWYGETGAPDPHRLHADTAVNANPTQKGTSARCRSLVQPFREPEPSTTATPGQETASASSSPETESAPSWSITVKTPTPQRRP